MRWYFREDTMERKVRRIELLTEVRDRQLWNVAECHIAGTLTEDEFDKLKRFVRGQVCDAGESFEQWPITLKDGMELYVHLYPEKGFFIKTEEELFRQPLEQGEEGPEYMFPGQSM